MNTSPLTAVRYDSATIRARALRLSFISLISLSTSSINLNGVILMTAFQKDHRPTYCIMKSTILCLSMVSECTLVMRNEISYPYFNHVSRNPANEKKPLTGTGFLRSTMKFSALCIINRVNLWQRIRSISSACLILILSRIELTEGSIRTRSFSLREIVRGLRRTSLEPLTLGNLVAA